MHTHNQLRADCSRINRLAGLALAGVAVCALTLTGCGEGGDKAAPGNSAATVSGDDVSADAAGDAKPGEPGVRELQDGHRLIVYAVRAEILSLPDGMNDLQAKHEAIPEFVTQKTNDDGSPVLGMNVMAMPFPADEGYDLSDLAVGDKAMLYFEVEYDAEGMFARQHRLVRHEKLPADTALNFAPLPSRGMDSGDGAGEMGDTGEGGDDAAGEDAG
jgi:hypothetical protein